MQLWLLKVSSRRCLKTILAEFRRVARRVVVPLRGTGGAKRQTEWIGSADQAYSGVTGDTKTLLQTFASTGSILTSRSTIIRTRGLLSISAGTEAADREIVGAMGMAVVSDQAAAAGAGSIPGPWSNQDWDGWFVWIAFAMSFGFTSAAGVLLEHVNFLFDSKAMRKFNSGESAVVMVETVAQSVRVAVPFRQLYKLA